MKRLSKFKLNTKELMDGVIAAITVENAPLILAKLGIPSAGMTGQIAAATLAYLVGSLLKKPTITNVGIAVAIGNLVNSMVVTPMLASMLPAATGGQNSNLRIANYGRLQPQLRDYINKPGIVPASAYAAQYN